MSWKFLWSGCVWSLTTVFNCVQSFFPTHIQLHSWCIRFNFNCVSHFAPNLQVSLSLVMDHFQLSSDSLCNSFWKLIETQTPHLKLFCLGFFRTRVCHFAFLIRISPPWVSHGVIPQRCRCFPHTTPKKSQSSFVKSRSRVTVSSFENLIIGRRRIMIHNVADPPPPMDVQGIFVEWPH